MFYLKYRPKTIDELDNSFIKDNVSKILSSKEIPHAILFIGQKGTGKTSTARIFAKSVNCLNRTSEVGDPPSGGKKTSEVKSYGVEPCNKCANCLAIESSSSSDVIELDAASNRGIEDVRNLIRESNFMPMTCKYRVFIIDEAHMITQDAFNALLKTLEEPPSTVIFILATTNYEKIPKTIASRCLIVNFRKARCDDILSMLKRIVVSEKIKIDEKLLSYISKFSDNSFRDAAKLLEELVTQKKLNLTEGLEYLGALKQNFLKIIVDETLKKQLDWLNEYYQSSGNFKHLTETLLEQLRLALLSKNGISTEEESDINLSQNEIIILMKLLTDAYNNLKISPIESLPLEIAVVEFYNQRNKGR